jgi:hypothetical protein
MLTTQSPTRDEVRQVLAAAADVLFDDGVTAAFLDHWADETMSRLLHDALTA